MPMSINNITEENKKSPTLPRIRSLPKAFEEIKKLDADTSFTMMALRKMCKTGEIPTFKVGNKTLLNLDLLLDKLYYQASA